MELDMKIQSCLNVILVCININDIVMVCKPEKGQISREKYHNSQHLFDDT